MVDLSTIKVALVHDWLAGMRGAERCLQCLCEIFPQSDIFSLFYIQGSVSRKLESKRIVTSFINKFPSIGSYYRYMLPIMPYAVEAFRFDDYDIVISDSSCVAKGVIVPNDVLHISYVYSPMRYAWDLSNLYFGKSGGHGELFYGLVSSLLHPIRLWDTSSWGRPDQIISISNFISKRVEKVCRRGSTVIHPPVDTKFFSKGLKTKKKDYFLMVTAFEPNRRPEVAIEECTRLKIPLKVVGSLGRYGEMCKRRAGASVEFLGSVSDIQLRNLYGDALALIVPGIEDFGMAPVEAMATGTPVIVSDQGGAQETVEGSQGEVGIVYEKSGGLGKAIEEVKRKWEVGKWDPVTISKHAQQFSKERFVMKFRDTVSEELARFRAETIRDTIGHN